MRITLRPLGKVAPDTLEQLQQRVGRVFHCPVTVTAGIADLAHAYDDLRGQYGSPKLIASLRRLSRDREERVVGIADVDLYAPGLNFVFGQADAATGVVVVSLTRLRQEYYGLGPEDDLFLERATKEIVHELGHTFALGHCPDPRCIMHFSNSLADTDWKQLSFCSNCCPQLDFLVQ